MGPSRKGDHKTVVGKVHLGFAFDKVAVEQGLAKIPMHNIYCLKQCFKLRCQAFKGPQGRLDIGRYPHIENKTGFGKHMYVKEHPRLVNEIPRGSKL